MRTVNLLIMSGALGIFCAGSPAVFAHAALPVGSKTNIGETKPPFKIPNGGGFKYKGKSSQGEVLLMEVKWQAAGTQSNGTIRISGDVKYKNPKIEKIDVRTIDGRKSYITKTGELFFALNDIDGKVYGPVDLAAVEAARLAKSDKPAEDKSGSDGAHGKNISPGANSQNSSDPSTKPTSTLPPKTDLIAERDSAGLDSFSLDASDKNASSGGMPINDIFQTQGEFNPADKRLTVKWKQANSIKNLKYPPGSKAISYEIYIDGKKQSGWKLTGPAYLDAKGFAHVPVVSPSENKHNYKSKDSFLSPNFNALVAAVDQIKKENAYIKKRNLSSLPNTIKDKKGNIIATDGTIILHAVIRSIKARNIAHRKSALAMRAYDNINRQLKMDGMGWIVHRMVEHAGLDVAHHKTHGRRLVGESSSGSQTTIQHGNNDSLVAASPTPVSRVVARVAIRRACENMLRDEDVDEVVAAVRRLALEDDSRRAHADALADFLAGQNYIYATRPGPSRMAYLDNIVRGLLYEANRFRRGEIDRVYFDWRVEYVTQVMQVHVRPSGIAAGDLVALILQMPGFQTDENNLRLAMRSRIVLEMNERLALVRLEGRHQLPSGVVDLIRQLAGLFVFHVGRTCEP